MATNRGKPQSADVTRIVIDNVRTPAHGECRVEVSANAVLVKPYDQRTTYSAPLSAVAAFVVAPPDRAAVERERERMMELVCDVCGSPLEADGMHPVGVIDNCVENPWRKITRAEHEFRRRRELEG